MKKNKLDISYQVKSNLSDYKEIDESGRTIKAIANTYNFYDSDSDVLRPGVAKLSIEQRGAKSDAADKILYAKFHDLTQLNGKSLIEKEAMINGNSVLYVEAKLLETPAGEETLQQYKEGIINQHSIGFRYNQINYIDNESEKWDDFLKDLINPEEAEKNGFGYDVTEIKLYEWSAVAFGANKLTPFLGVKSENKAIQLQGLYQKMDALIKTANRQDSHNKKIYELQYMQLKQLIAESISDVSFDKSVCKKPDEIKKSLNRRYLII